MECITSQWSMFSVQEGTNATIGSTWLYIIRGPDEQKSKHQGRTENRMPPKHFPIYVILEVSPNHSPIKKNVNSSYFGCIIPHVLDTDLGLLSRASPCLQYRTTSRKRFLAKRDMDQSWMARREERWGVWSCCAVNVAGWEIHEVNRGFFLPGKSS